MSFKRLTANKSANLIVLSAKNLRARRETEREIEIKVQRAWVISTRAADISRLLMHM